MVGRNKRLAALVVFLIIGSAALAYYFISAKEKALPGSDHAVRIMDPLEANNLHVPLAKELGYFADEGVEVEVSHTSAGKFAMDALNARSVEYAVVVEMNVAQTLFHRDDVVILAEIAEPIKAIKFLGRSDHGVASADDLRGKRVGVLFGVNIHLFLLRYLQENRIPVDEVNLVNLRPPDAAAAFRSGDIDAIVTWQPHAYRLQSDLGDKVVVLTDDASRYWTYKMVVATNREYYEAHQEEAKAILRALVRSDDYIRHKPAEAQEFLGRLLNIEVTAVRSFFEEIHFEVRLTERLLEMLDVEVEWLRGGLLKGQSPVTQDYRSLVAPALQDVRDSAYRLGS